MAFLGNQTRVEGWGQQHPVDTPDTGHNLIVANQTKWDTGGNGKVSARKWLPVWSGFGGVDGGLGLACFLGFISSPGGHLEPSKMNVVSSPGCRLLQLLLKKKVKLADGCRVDRRGRKAEEDQTPTDDVMKGCRFAADLRLSAVNAGSLHNKASARYFGWLGYIFHEDVFFFHGEAKIRDNHMWNHGPGAGQNEAIALNLLLHFYPQAYL